VKNITIRQLRYVAAAGQHLSISAAATECNISQSSVTAAINALEAEVGFDLFSRAPSKGLQTTPAGSDALKLIEEMLSKASAFESELRSIGSNDVNRIKIACFASIAAIIVPPILEVFQRDFPSVDITFVECESEDAVSLIESGRAHLAFAFEDLCVSKHTFKPLLRTPYYALVPEGWKIANKTSVSLAELSRHPMLQLESPTASDYIMRSFEERGLEIEVAYRTRWPQLIHNLVARNYGFAILNIRQPWAERPNLGCCALAISDTLEHRVLGIMCERDVVSPNLASAFVQTCERPPVSEIYENIIAR